jgi:hypothetical protein
VARTRVSITVVVCFAIVGCGGGSDRDSADPALIAQGSAVARCESAMFGAVGSNDWRQLANAVGRFGVYGTGRDFRTAEKTPLTGFRGLQQRRVSGPILLTKTPFVVEGRQPVEVAIDPRDRVRAGLVVAPFDRPGPYAEIRFVPCRDQPRTWWPGGWVLRDQGRVAVSIHEQNGPESQLVVGRKLPAVGERSERPVRGHLTGTACQRLAELAGQQAGADDKANEFLLDLGKRAAGISRGGQALLDLARGGTNRIVGRGFRPEYDDGSTGQVRHFVGLARASMFGGVQTTRWISEHFRDDAPNSADGRLGDQGIEFAQDLIAGRLALSDTATWIRERLCSPSY